jgi:hypothetical protein
MTTQTRNPATPGILTSEGLFTLLTTLAGAVIGLLALFHVGVPARVNSLLDPIIGSVSFFGSAIAVAVYSHSRTGLKQSLIAAGGAVAATLSTGTISNPITGNTPLATASVASTEVSTPEVTPVTTPDAPASSTVTDLGPVTATSIG